MYFLSFALLAASANAQHDHEWHATLHVVDESGVPVVAANAHIYYGRTNEAGGPTDVNGLFTASHRDASENLYIHVDKAGFYPFEVTYSLGRKFVPEIWNPTQTVVLKKIGNPIPMYARDADIEIPELEKLIGYDLIQGDWVTPYGKGKLNDFIFLVSRRWDSRDDFDCAFKLTFPNPGDGLVPVSIPLNQGSTLRMSAEAPSHGYLSEISKSMSRSPGKGWKHDDRHSNKEQNYYFRIRTVLDSQGNVKSALYGKIYDDFDLTPIKSKTVKILFSYYLNPEPNSRNTEFDPKHNLFKKLTIREQVSAP